MRLISGFVALLVACSLAGTATAARGPKHQVDRGIVQSVSASQIVLRELDGSVVSIGVDADTQVFLNGRPAALTDIQPGFVALVAHNGDDAALTIRALGQVQPAVDSGAIVSRTGVVLRIRTADGTTMSFRLTARTKIRWHGLPARVAALRPGRFATVVHTASGEALRIVIRLRGPA
jgi:hypothetical protein